MKKTIGIILVGLCMLCMACTNTATNDSDKRKIIATTFPVYDWTREILGDRINDVELTLLINTGVDLHSYQPTIQEVAEISTADMFIYIGGVSDGWVHEVLEQRKNRDMVIVSMFDILGDDVKMEEIVEGMEAHVHGDHNHDEHDHDEHDHDEHNHDEHDHDEHNHDEHDHDEHNHDEHDHDEHNHDEHDHDEHNHDEHDHDEHNHDEHNHDVHNHDDNSSVGYEDEHVWLSLKNAELFVTEIAKELGFLDPDYARVYRDNANTYVEKIHALDHEYEEAVKNSKNTPLLVADRFPFLYLVDDYDIDYYAAFVGCSAETEASFETVAFLSGKVDELGLRNIIMIDGTTHKIPQTVSANTVQKDQNIVLLNAMQSTASADIEAGATYLGIMEENLEVLKEVLEN